MEPEPEPPGAAFFCLEPEPTQVGRSRSRLRDLGDPEPEPPKKVAAPQHCGTGIDSNFGRDRTNVFFLLPFYFQVAIFLTIQQL